MRTEMIIMYFGNSLLSIFAKESHGYLNARSSIKEVDLFRFFINALRSMPDYTVGEIHGNRRQVVFKESEGWYTRNSRCELGDVAILAFSKIKGEGRLVIIQNKVSRNSAGKFCGNLNNVHTNLVQHELLTVRPVFQYIKSPGAGMPNSLIQASPYSSVCLYGNFYINAGNVDMSSFTASKLVFPSSSFKRGIPRTGNHPTAYIEYTGPFQTMASHGGCSDFVGAKSLLDFGDLLEDLYIGKPISYREKKKIEGELFSLLQSHQRSISESIRIVIRDFQEAEFRTQTNDYDNDNYPENSLGGILNICRSLLIVNVDPKS